MGHVLEFSLERLTSLQLQVRDRSLTIVSAYEPNISVEYLAFLEALGGELECSPTGNSIVLPGVINAQLQQQQYYL